MRTKEEYQEALDALAIYSQCFIMSQYIGLDDYGEQYDRVDASRKKLQELIDNLKENE